MEAYAIAPSSAPFSSSRAHFEGLVNWLDGPGSEAMTHGEMEARLNTEGRELLRRLLQDHLDLRAQREVRHEQVVGADGVARRNVERGHERALSTIFGGVQVRRLAYRTDFVTNLYPADAVLKGVVAILITRPRWGAFGRRDAAARSFRQPPRTDC